MKINMFLWTIFPINSAWFSFFYALQHCVFCNVVLLDFYVFGEKSGIRTHDTVSRIHTFQACAVNMAACSALLSKRNPTWNGSPPQHVLQAVWVQFAISFWSQSWSQCLGLLALRPGSLRNGFQPSLRSVHCFGVATKAATPLSPLH